MSSNTEFTVHPTASGKNWVIKHPVTGDSRRWSNGKIIYYDHRGDAEWDARAESRWFRSQQEEAV
jgi:hypothetical protein